jgi:hypothetical protein
MHDANGFEKTDRRMERQSNQFRGDDRGCDAVFADAASSFATTKGLSQIVTPDLQTEGELSAEF